MRIMRIDKVILREIGPFADATIEFLPGKDPDLADVYLLTGPNGSGKSTVLYALAGIIGCGHAGLGQDFGAQRMRSQRSVAALSGDVSPSATAWYQTEAGERSSIPDPFGGAVLKRVNSVGHIGYYSPYGANQLKDYVSKASNFQIALPADSRPKFSWAAFAYAGMRSLHDAHVSAIQEPTESPFAQSLSFVHTADANRLAHWVANQDFRRLKAKELGHQDRAEQLERSIRDIERVVSEIIGEQFSFVASDEDHNVRVRRNGANIQIGLLPDGLKSIVSWIADLLMRLDRIPWVDNTPPMQRPFLLLLDEVDIHLHPSWQRKVLPIVQRIFPKAQIIASTHSPFVVASAQDASIIALKLEDGVSSVESVSPGQVGVSYSAVLRSIFGIESQFDVETERDFSEFHEAKSELLSGVTIDRTRIQRLSQTLAQRSEEVKELVAIELRQLERQLQARSKE